MKGLLLKDAYMIGKLCRAFILIDIVFIAAAFWGNGNIFFIFYPCVISGMLPMTLISYDEKEKWDKYAGTLPFTRAQLVSSKYIIGLCGNVAVLTLIAAAQVLRMSVGKEPVSGEYFIGMLTLLSAGLIAPAVLFPFVFKLGAEKGRIFYYVVIGIVCAGSTALVNNTDITDFTAGMNSLTGCAVFAAAVLLYSASWLLSVHFYKQREL